MIKKTTVTVGDKELDIVNKDEHPQNIAETLHVFPLKKLIEKRDKLKVVALRLYNQIEKSNKTDEVKGILLFALNETYKLGFEKWKI